MVRNLFRLTRPKLCLPVGRFSEGGPSEQIFPERYRLGGRYQIVPHDEETGDQPAEPEEFDSIEEAEKFLEKNEGAMEWAEKRSDSG